MIKKVLKRFVPASLMAFYRRGSFLRRQKSFADKSSSETFTEIYEKNLWGGEPGAFFSGDGSAEEYAAVYAANVSKFLRENGCRNIVDIGCGDFRVASKLISEEISYTGIDVVPSLIDRNRELYSSESVTFLKLDATSEDLPDGDVCLIRQVLQHLSNDEIISIIKKCSKFRFVLVTEHYPSELQQLTPNIDIPHGPGIRLYLNSAVVLDRPPFNIDNVSLLFEVQENDGSKIKTFVISN